MEPKYSGFGPDDEGKEAKPGESPQPQRVVHSLLDLLEDLLIRMIKGVVRFTFIRVPVKIIQYLNRYFPTLVRIFRVLFLLIFWLLLAVIPAYAILCWGDPRLWPFWGDTSTTQRHLLTPNYALAVSRIFNFASLPSVLSTGWLAIWAAGSVWGLLFTVRRRRRERRQRRAERAAVPAELNPLPQGRGRR